MVGETLHQRETISIGRDEETHPISLSNFLPSSNPYVSLRSPFGRFLKWAFKAHFFFEDFLIKMQTSKILAQVEALCNPVLESMGYELAERELIVEHGKWVLRLYIDREGGVGLKDCEVVSRAVEGALDVENLIGPPYFLEVSSPGIDRPLRRPRDFDRFAGETVELRMTQPLLGRTHFIGLLKGIRDEKILIMEGDQELQIPLELLKKARLRRKYGGQTDRAQDRAQEKKSKR